MPSFSLDRQFSGLKYKRYYLPNPRKLVSLLRCFLNMHSSRVVFRAPTSTTTNFSTHQHLQRHRHHTSSATSLTMSICRSISLMLLSLTAGVLVVSGIIFSTTVGAQQSGSIPGASSGTESNSTEKQSPTVISPTNSNNYAASIAALTVGHKPTHFNAFSSSSSANPKTDTSKYTGKLMIFLLLKNFCNTKSDFI